LQYLLEREQRLARPRSEVFAFFADAANLERITPPSLRFAIQTPAPIVMAAGTIIDYRIALFGVRFRWRTRIESFQSNTSFVDVQTRGPYAFWRHQHAFTDDGRGGTTMRDRVEYRLPFGPLGRLVHALFVRRQLARIFDHRRRVIAQMFGDA
jgi:ligand-binding SRPBCC domain-containing protein